MGGDCGYGMLDWMVDTCYVAMRDEMDERDDGSIPRRYLMRRYITTTDFNNPVDES